MSHFFQAVSAASVACFCMEMKSQLPCFPWCARITVFAFLLTSSLLVGNASLILVSSVMSSVFLSKRHVKIYSE